MEQIGQIGTCFFYVKWDKLDIISGTLFSHGISFLGYCLGHHFRRHNLFGIKYDLNGKKMEQYF